MTTATAPTTYPRRTESGELVWACCESSIGRPCNHELGGEAVNERTRQLVELATLTRAEWAARLRFDYASRIVGAIPEGEADDDDLDWVTDTYIAWCKAWEALTAARRELEAGA